MPMQTGPYNWINEARVLNQLNSSFRTLAKPPYEVTETGWGEFEIVIKIYFQDPAERPVTIYHVLKLFQAGQPTDHNSLMKNQKTVVSEFYDEIIFQVQ